MIHSSISTVFDKALFPRDRFSSVELSAVGAAIFGGAAISEVIFERTLNFCV